MNDKLKREIDLLAEKHGFSVVRFDYNQEAFGNIILNIEINGRELSFVTDRGEICCNGRTVSGCEYLTAENKTTDEKLVEVVEDILKAME